MSVDGSVELVFGGDTRRFRLAIKNLIALQEKRNSGPMEIVQRLQLGIWRVEDIVETLRIGLLGGYGDNPTPEQDKTTRALVEAHVREGNITPHVLTALAVLLSALQGDPDEPVGKKARVRRKKPGASASPPQPTTATAQ
jgi:hypothetical protein